MFHGQLLDDFLKILLTCTIWVATVKDLLLEYGLPSAYELFVNPPYIRILRHHIIRAYFDKEVCQKRGLQEKRYARK